MSDGTPPTLATDLGGVERRVPRPALDWSFYERVLRSRSPEVVGSVLVPPDSGRSARVPAGHIVRLSGPEGAQIGDVCFWNAVDPSERLWANQTLNREGSHLSAGSRLWGTMPNFRPLLTIVADTVPKSEGPARHHIILGAHCNRWMWSLATGRLDHPNCYDQLCAAAREAGIDEALVHDNLNLFQRTRIDPQTGHYVTEGSAARSGDHVELYAEIDVVVGVSTCPLGSGRFRAESGERDPKPLLIEIFETGVAPRPFSYT